MDGRRAKRAAVFLDRDGTIMVDTGYPSDPDEVALLPGAADALRGLHKRGYALVIVSNQSGIGRGLVTSAQASAVHERVASTLLELGVPLDGAYYCPHGPDDACNCRKPLPGLLRQAASELALDLTRSFMVGDCQSDVEAGRSVGCTTILLGRAEGVADVIARTWEDVLAAVAALEAL